MRSYLLSPMLGLLSEQGPDTTLLHAQVAAEVPPPEASASPLIGEPAAAAPERKPPSIRASSRGIGAFLTQVKDTAAKVRRP